MKSPHISLLIPTIGREEISICLSQFIHVKEISEVVILDSGEIPIVNSKAVLNIIRCFELEGKTIKYIRSLKKGIGNARWQLINNASNPYCLMVDDDIIISQNNTLSLINKFIYSNYTFAVPCCYIPIDFLGVKFLDRAEKTLSEVLSIAGDRDYILPYFKYTEALGIPMGYSGTQAIIFNRLNALEAVLLPVWKSNREDIYLTKTMGNGVLFTDIYSYHLENKEQYREWHNSDEENNYNRVISGDYNGFYTKD